MKNKVQRHFPYLKKNKLLLLGAITVLVCSSNALAQNNGNKLVSDNFDFAKRQMVHMLENIPQGEAKMPHSIMVKEILHVGASIGGPPDSFLEYYGI